MGTEDGFVDKVPTVSSSGREIGAHSGGHAVMFLSVLLSAQSYAPSTTLLSSLHIEDPSFFANSADSVELVAFTNMHILYYYKKNMITL